jgi:hypothetical protein
MSEWLTDEQLRELQENAETYTMVHSPAVLSAIAELLVLRDELEKVARGDPVEAMRAKCEAIMQDAANNPLLADGTELDIATIDWLSRRFAAAALKGASSS